MRLSAVERRAGVFCLSEPRAAFKEAVELGRKLSQEARDRTMQLIEQGLTGREIADAFGVAHGALLQRCHVWGLRIPRQRFGSHNSNWRGGPPARIDHNGYIKLYRPSHPHGDCKGYVFEHRLAMEDKLRRYLTETEVVHHKDHDRRNNAVENLALFGSQRAHIAYHVRTDPKLKPRNSDLDDLPF